MKKPILLLLFVFFSSILFAQLTKPTSAVTHKSIENNPIATPNELIIPDGTICFTEKGQPETVALTKTNYICSIKKFTAVSEAEAFASTFSKSDPNISNFSFTKVENDIYYFNFSIMEPKDTKWYLALFQKNNLQFIKYNKQLESIEKLLSK